MQTKPLVSCHGDQALFSSLHPTILQGLPKESVEWKRSYGRGTKTVVIEGSFVPYDEDILPNEGDRNLINRPFFHIYWTDCDLETYKTSVKEGIHEWQTALKQRAIPDWMIVIVMNDEPKLKTKILPRTSVMDKIRSDFCNKQTDRCIAIVNPCKTDVKSVESWNNFYTKLRTHMLQSYNRNLGKYEEMMRSFRERRNEPGWHFIEYSLVQEELAFIYEMIGVYDEALLQYDELDALFTQFVLNQATGSTAPWLARFLEPQQTWSSLSLARSIDQDTRQSIKLNRVSLLDFRNYLFSRQCAVLFLMDETREVVLRSREFLHNTMHELQLMKISGGERGIEACWVFVSGLEVLQTCGGTGDVVQMELYATDTTSLWDCVRLKLKELGELFGLMPHSTTTGDVSKTLEEPSNVLQQITQYSSEDANPNFVTRPVDKLRHALSSREAFRKHYLELSELTMGTFKHIGRLRSARRAGLDLADFYMQLGEASKAELFFIDALKAYKHEGWTTLAEETNLRLAECQNAIGNQHKYAQTVCNVTSSESLSIDVKLQYYSILLNLARLKKDTLPYILPLSSIATILDVVVLASSFTVNSRASVTIALSSRLPLSIVVDRMTLSLHKQPPNFHPHRSVANENGEPGAKVAAKVAAKRSHSRNLSGPFMTFNPVHKQLPNEITLQVVTPSKVDKTPAPGAVALSCPHATELLKRSDSGSGGLASKKPLVKDDHAFCVTRGSVTIYPGLNDICLTNQILEHGFYKLGQLWIELGQIGFIHNQVTPCPTYFEAVYEPSRVELSCKDADAFVAGTSHKALLQFHSGTTPVPHGASLRHAPLAAVSLASGSEVPIDPIGGMEATGIEVDVLCDMCHEDRVYEMEFFPSWIPDTVITCNIKVISPISIQHKVHTTKFKKLLQVIVEGQTTNTVTLSCATLTCLNCSDVDLQPLLPPSTALTVRHQEDAAYYVWNIAHQQDAAPYLDLDFSFRYTSLGQSDDGASYSYKFTLKDYQTLYNVKTRILPAQNCSGDNWPKVGSPCTLEVKVERLATYSLTSSEVFLLYGVESDEETWTVVGKTKGVFSLADDAYTVCLSAIPLRPGRLPHPGVTLTKYQTYDDHDADEDSVYFTRDQVYAESLREGVTVHPANHNISADIACITTCS